ncbi:MAG: naphthalene 1,2-dioxygenase [Phenylobacterium sp.]|nr:naphthalene 1,2-dioxygenase [Phenylobacterium sp.]
MAKVTELGYVGLNISDAEAWKRFATEVVGLELMDEGEGDRLYLRMDYWHHRFVLHLSDTDDMAYAGWRVADEQALDEIKAQLQAGGYSFRDGTPDEAKERRVLGLIKLDDPSGNPVEVFYGPLIDAHLPFHPGRRMHGRWMTGDQGLGHILIQSDDYADTHRFYSALGLRGNIQYHLNSPAGMVQPAFMYCNDRQHSLAYGVNAGKRLGHMMLEYSDLNDLGKAHDLVRGQGIDVALQLGKHSNDDALTFYFVTPSGWLLELGWGGAKSFHQQQYHLSDVFGHGVEAAGAHAVEL